MGCEEENEAVERIRILLLRTTLALTNELICILFFHFVVIVV